MVGILILTHGDLGRAFIKAAEIIMGIQNSLKSLSFLISDDLVEKREEILELLKDLDCGEGVILLTDLLGGSPTNLAISFLNIFKVDVITGLNLPLLIHLLQHRQDASLENLLSEAEMTGRKFLCRISDLLSEAV